MYGAGEKNSLTHLIHAFTYISRLVISFLYTYLSRKGGGGWLVREGVRGRKEEGRRERKRKRKKGGKSRVEYITSSARYLVLSKYEVLVFSFLIRYSI